MGWLGDILDRGRRLQLAEVKATIGWELPENPTPAEIRAEAFRISQMAKVVQNTEHPWSDDQWRKISKAIEAIRRE
jgi:hypothetical protein